MPKHCARKGLPGFGRRRILIIARSVSFVAVPIMEQQPRSHNQSSLELHTARDFPLLCSGISSALAFIHVDAVEKFISDLLSVHRLARSDRCPRTTVQWHIIQAAIIPGFEVPSEDTLSNRYAVSPAYVEFPNITRPVTAA